MEYNQSGKEGNPTMSGYHNYYGEEQTYQPACQYELSLNESRSNIPVKNLLFQRQQHFNFTHKDFGNNFTHDFDMTSSSNNFKNLINDASPLCRSENAYNMDESYAFQRNLCEYNNTSDRNLQPYSSKDYIQVPQIVGNVSTFQSNCTWPSEISRNYADPRANTTQRGMSNVKINNFDHGGVFPNSKRSRTVFRPHQIQRLQYEFEREMYMVGMKRKNLSRELDLSEKQIKIWFQNKRMKQKREHHRRLRHNFSDNI